MLQFQSLSFARGQQTLLENANLVLPPKAKVGFIGANGSGKSSLFAVILGLIEPETGSVLIPKASTISSITQEVPDSDFTALDYVLDGHQVYRDLERAIQHAEEHEDYEKAAHWYTEWHAQDCDRIKAKASKILHGLGFTEEQTLWTVSQFSGGWRVRIQLARTLLNPGDILLMDEPTNHLDLEALIWLEKWCMQYEGLIVMISHDIAFLDNITNQIIHIENKTLTLYKGNYSTFVKTRAERIMLNEKMRQKQDKEREHLQSFINRFKAKASKAKQAQSRAKRLEKMETIAAYHASSPFQFEFAPVECPNPVIRITDGRVGYEYKTVLSNMSFYLGDQERIALLGKNGQGKSTFVKLLAGELKLSSGDMVVPPKLRIGYFAQHQVESLKLNDTPLETIKKFQPTWSEQEVRTYLGRFNFGKEKCFTLVGELSGGERARLAFAIMILDKPHLVLLDEPTNHLDIEIREALALALQSFNGALVVVSHDRAFIESCCDKLYLIDNGNIQLFDGDLQDYGKWASQKEPAATQEGSKSAQSDHKKKKQLNNQIKKIETDIERFSQQLKTLEVALADPVLYTPAGEKRGVKLLAERDTLQQQLKALESEWEQMQQTLDDESESN